MDFLTQYRIYKWVVMPIGLMNAPEVFMSAINNLFVDLLDKGVVFFLDDVLVFRTTIEKHFELLEKVFIYFHKHAFYCKLKK